MRSSWSGWVTDAPLAAASPSDAPLTIPTAMPVAIAILPDVNNSFRQHGMCSVKRRKQDGVIRLGNDGHADLLWTNC